MRTRIGFGIAAMWLIAGIGTTGSARLVGEERKTPNMIRAEDIGETVTVLGRLGRPLHEAMTVRGTWIPPEPNLPKPDITLRFRVDQVNGNRLDKAVDFRADDVTVAEKLGTEVVPAKGERWELLAYETWPVREHPSEYWEALGVATPAPPPHGATRMFAVLKQRTDR